MFHNMYNNYTKLYITNKFYKQLLFFKITKKGESNRIEFSNSKKDFCGKISF